MLFKKKIEKRAEVPDQNNQNIESSIKELLLGKEIITRDDALQIPSIQACITKISGTIARLPIKLYIKVSDKPEEITDDKRIKLLNQETGDTLNVVEFWKALIEDYYLGRGGFAYINSKGQAIESLNYVDSELISIMSNTDPIFKKYWIQINGYDFFDFKFIKLLRKTKDGYRNIPLQEECSKVISASLNGLKLENSMSKSGGAKGGFLKSKSKLSKQVMDDIREGYESLYDSFNKDRNRKILVLNDGMEFQEISATAAEMQVNETKKSNSVEICKCFGFPHTVIDGGATPEDMKQFISVVIDIINLIETELDSKLLLESEKDQGYYFAFDTKELTRGSQLERYEAYQIALKNRFLQVDEVRKLEDYEPMGFDFIPLSLGDVLYDPKTKELFTPNTGKDTFLNNGKQNDKKEVKEINED